MKILILIIKVLRKFLKSIGYLIDEKDEFNIETAEMDEEISSISATKIRSELREKGKL